MNLLHYKPHSTTTTFFGKKMLSKKGFHLRSILLHSSWITITGIFLFRLATANTQKVVYVKTFAISGVILATAPWIIQLLVSTAIIFMYKAKVCDLTWLVVLPSEDTSFCQDIKAVEKAIRESVGIGRGNAQGLVNKDLRLPSQVDGRNGPYLKRNRTV